jgi:hypothetical protein
MHTGQNSIALEYSLPQLERVGLSSVFMSLTLFVAIRAEGNSRLHREGSGWHRFWQSVVPFHK